jgi:hypothetical protein
MSPAANQLATEHPDILHGTGKKWAKAFLKARKHLIGKVSQRAVAGHKEFVSEVFAQLVVGTEPVDRGVLRAYKKYGGREI